MFEEEKNIESLKEITAYKKKLNWGEIPAIYHMAASSISDLEGLLTHGFESGYKSILNKNVWNLEFLGAYTDSNGELQVKNKPQIMLRHVFTEHHYELHCYPVVLGEPIYLALKNNPCSPFENWAPEIMKRLFRISNLISFIIYAFQNGDEADLKLIYYSHLKVQGLIETLGESFDIVKVKGYDIAEFCTEIYKRQPNMHLDGLLNDEDDNN